MLSSWAQTCDPAAEHSLRGDEVVAVVAALTAAEAGAAAVDG
jgi:hypothetical protein